MKVRVITPEDNLDELVAQINQAAWDEANEMSEYDVEALSAYLERQDTVFVACYEMSSERSTLLGMASARIEIKPYGKERWLYVDEVDVCADQRQRGAGKLIMQKLIAIAKDQGCEELWLGTEVDNHPANALYRSIEPDDVAEFIGYTYEMDD
ncbi:MAG: GNAT family N-acetyltransferase [Cyanobacteria bacterium P01_F01_bin.53]